jgi:hypothetical protein
VAVADGPNITDRAPVIAALRSVLDTLGTRPLAWLS